MTQISFLIKPASSLCNLRCKYCFYSDLSHNREIESMGIMKNDVMEALIEQSLELPVNQVNYCFQGGEPLCAGIDYFNKFISCVNEKNIYHKKIQYSIQTNGTLLDNQWIKFLKKNHFLVGISIDGFIKNHDYFRKDFNGKGTLKKILYNLRSLKNTNIDYNILTVLTKELSKKPEELYKFYKDNGFDFVQIIPCLPSLQQNELTDIFSLKPKDFSTFYKKFFDLWFDDFKKQKYMSVTLFDNILMMYKGNLPQQCGMLGKCYMQLVIEGNGNIYPCDFYVLDQYCCGNIVQDSLEEVIQNDIAKQFIHEERKKCTSCSNCEFVHMCHGNCKRLSVCYFDENYCGYMEFLSYCKEKMAYIAQRVPNKII